jgi:hypothetical protein
VESVASADAREEAREVAEFGVEDVERCRRKGGREVEMRRRRWWPPATGGGGGGGGRATFWSGEVGEWGRVLGVFQSALQV